MITFNGLKIGDKIVCKNWKEFHAKVVDIKRFDNQNQETNWDFNTGYVRIKLDWSDYNWGEDQKYSWVNAHDENKTWYRYSSAN